MIDFPGNLIRVDVTFDSQIGLPFFGKFPQIMPESGEVAPFVSGLSLGGIRGEHFRGELGGPEGDFVEVAVVGGEVSTFLAGFPLTLVSSFTERGEEWFPVFLRFSVEGVGIEFHEGREKNV